MAPLKTLGPRLGPVLFQCPPTLRYDPSRIESFLEQLPTGFRYAFEFRHPSWGQAREMIVSRGVAWCAAETDAAPADAADLRAGPFAYLRLRKSRYSDEELAGWAGAIRHVLSQGRDVFCYFKHEEKALGPAMAKRMLRLVEGEVVGGP